MTNERGKNYKSVDTSKSIGGQYQKGNPRDPPVGGGRAQIRRGGKKRKVQTCPGRCCGFFGPNTIRGK